MKISKVEVQKNHKDRVNIFVDDEYYSSMFLDTAVKYGIKKDLEINDEEFQKYLIESEQNLAFNKAFNYLNTTFKTAKQMRDYLNKKGYDSVIIDNVINKLKDYNYLDDKKFAEIYINSFKTKYGKNMLKNKLLSKGVSKNIIDELLNDFESKETIIEKLLIKKIGNKPITYDLLTKCSRFLSSRGFGFDEINYAIRKYKDKLSNVEDSDESWD